MKISICIVVLLSEISGRNLPSYIKPCSLRSPEFSKCAVENGNAAIPFLANGDKHLKIPSLSPLILPLVELSTGGLKLNATEVKVTGIPNVYMTDMKIDEQEQTILINLTNPLIELEFNYNIDGKLINIPVGGEGTGNITILECVFLHTFDFRLNEINGKHYAEFVKDDLVMHPKDFKIQLNNLFNGNKLLGENTNKFANENWREILDDVRPAVSEVVGSIIRKTALNLFKLFPLEVIFTDYN